MVYEIFFLFLFFFIYVERVPLQRVPPRPTLASHSTRPTASHRVPRGPKASRMSYLLRCIPMASQPTRPTLGGIYRRPNLRVPPRPTYRVQILYSYKFYFFQERCVKIGSLFFFTFFYKIFFICHTFFLYDACMVYVVCTCVHILKKFQTFFHFLTPLKTVKKGPF